MQLFDQELIRLTFIVGIAVSVWLYEKTHTTTGSLVVPGYVGAQLLNPVALLTTAVNAALTFYLVSRVLPRFAAVYGRARFVVNILVSIVISVVLGPVVGSFTGPSIPLLDTIGYVIPALIAYDMNRQGPGKTLGAVGVSGAIAAIPALVLVLLDPGRVAPMLPTDTGLLAVGDVWFPIVALISTLVSATLFHNHHLRSGGFVGPMYLGLAAVRPEQLVYFLGMALVVYAAVHLGLKRVMILFGRRKFATMLMLGSLLSWSALELANALLPGVLAIGGLPIAALFVPAVLANDMERTSPTDVLVGGLVAASTTLSVTIVLAGVVDGLPVPGWAVLLLSIALPTLLWPQVAMVLGRIPLPSIPLPSIPVPSIPRPLSLPVPAVALAQRALGPSLSRPLAGVGGSAGPMFAAWAATPRPLAPSARQVAGLVPGSAGLLVSAASRRDVVASSYTGPMFRHSAATTTVSPLQSAPVSTGSGSEELPLFAVARRGRRANSGPMFAQQGVDGDGMFAALEREFAGSAAAQLAEQIQLVG